MSPIRRPLPPVIDTVVAARGHATNDNAPLPGRAEDNCANKPTNRNYTLMTPSLPHQSRYLLDLLLKGPHTTKSLLVAGIRNPSAAASSLRAARIRIAARRLAATNDEARTRDSLCSISTNDREVSWRVGTATEPHVVSTKKCEAPSC